MKVICAWCKKPMGEYATTEAMLSVGADTSSRWLDPTEQLPELVSHGICDRCAAKLEAEIEEQVSDEAAKTDFDHAPQACPVMRWHNKGGTK